MTTNHNVRNVTVRLIHFIETVTFHDFITHIQLRDLF